ncbi:MAG: hypothetical protein WDN31_16890 [Hyphomicrobium sp.]
MGTQRLDGARAGFLIDIGNHDAGALGEEAPGDGIADAPGSAGNDGDLVVETHEHSLRSTRFIGGQEIKRNPAAIIKPQNLGKPSRRHPAPGPIGAGPPEG